MINVALFGLGRIGQMHAENLFNNKSFKLKFVYDVDYKLTQKISKKFNCAGLKNYKIAIESKVIDVIFISTSTNTHIKFLTEAVKKKKIVFCEKPLDLNLKKINNQDFINAKTNVIESITLYPLNPKYWILYEKILDKTSVSSKIYLSLRNNELERKNLFLK